MHGCMDAYTDYNRQWAMIGGIGIIFAFLPESPWWLASKDKLEKAAKILHSCNGKVEGYDVDEQIVSLNTETSQVRNIHSL